jgi:hypothetical protein
VGSRCDEVLGLVAWTDGYVWTMISCGYLDEGRVRVKEGDGYSR